MSIEPNNLTLASYKSEKLAELKEQEARALSILRLSLEDGPLLQTKEVKSPFILWNKLKALYQSKGFSSDFLLSKELINTSLANCKGNVEDYLQKVKRLTNSLEARKLTLPNKFVAALVLNNLTRDYNYLVAIITQDLRSDKDIDLDVLFSQILDESRRLKGLKSPISSTTSNNYGSSNSNSDVEMSLNSNKYYKKGNSTNSTNRTNRSNIKCSYCKKAGHKSGKCWYKPQNENKANISTEEEIEEIEDSLNTSVIINVDSKIQEINTCYKASIGEEIITWVLDSGASTHVCYREDLFTKLNPINNTFIKWGNTSSLLKAKAKGNISVKFTSTNKPIMLENVLLVPELKVNLLSMYQALEKGANFQFTLKEGLIFKNNSLIAKGDYTKKIATFATISNKKKIEHASNTNEAIGSSSNIVSSQNSSSSNTATSQKNFSKIKDNTLLLHKRFGHIGASALKKIAKSQEMAINIEIPELKNCIICIESKLTSNISKNPITTKVDEFGDLVYIDLGGPIKPVTNKGYRYYITFLDYKTKYLEVELLTSRAELINPLKSFYNRVKIQDNKLITQLQADNEISSKEINNFAKENSINIRLTPPFNPEPKGGAERINRTLFNKIRALLFEAKLPRKYWAEALLSAVYLYNRTPHSSIDFCTLYEAKYGTKPNLANIKIWGSLTYKKEPKEFINKLDSRAKPYYLVGYTSNNLYRLLDPKSTKVTLARDVKVIEGSYYHTKANQQEDLILEENSLPEENSILEENSLQAKNSLLSKNSLLEENTTKNKDIIIRRNPIVLIPKRKETIDYANCIETKTTSSVSNLLSQIIEDIYYTSKAIGDLNNYKQVLLHKEKEGYLLAM